MRNTEDGGAGADAKPDGGDCREGKYRVAAQVAKGVRQVLLEHVAEHGRSLPGSAGSVSLCVSDAPSIPCHRGRPSPAILMRHPPRQCRTAFESGTNL